MTERRGIMQRSKFPTKELSKVYHVGTLDPAMVGRGGAKHGISLEGHHLSISLHPEAWRRIARLGDAPCWELERKGAQLLDMTTAQQNAALVEKAISWGKAGLLVKEASIWRAHKWDAEGKGWRFSDCHEIGEAIWYAIDDLMDGCEDQAGADAIDDAASCFEREPSDGNLDKLARTLEEHARAEFLPEQLIERRSSIRSLQRLEDCTGRSPSIGAEAIDSLLIAWSEHLGFDGCWWEAELEPAMHSAPRGLIFRQKVESWRAEVKPCFNPDPA